jgi:hypothetical protein
MLMQFSVESALVGNLPAIALELKKLVVGCRQHLFTLGLQRYLDEAPAPHQIAAFRSTAVSKKEEMEDALSCSLSVLKALSSQLKQLPPTSSGPEARDSNRQVIDGWLSKSQPSEDAPLASAQQLYVYRDALVGVLNAEMLSELIRLYPPCRDQLAALGLSNYLEEMPLLQAPQIAKPTAAAPQRIALSDKERFTRELAFFRDMIKQDDKDVNQWLKENSPKLDYPLLWAKKRKPLLSHFRDSVSIDLRREWGFCAETCLERVPTDSVHVDLKQIPALRIELDDPLFAL